MARKVVFVSAATTETVLDWPSMIAGLRRAYSTPHQDRTSFRAVARGEGVWLRSLVAVPPTSQIMGAKIFGRARQRQVTYLVPLFDQASSELLALIDGRHLTAMRTAATSAIAVDRLMPRAAVNLGVLGSGGEARSHVQALSTIRQIARLRVYSPNPKKRAQFAEHFQQVLGVPCEAFDSPEPVVRESNLVVAAARSRDETPILSGQWLNSGCALVSIGSTIPEQRELDTQTIDMCDLIVCDMLNEVQEETGDFLAAKSAGINLAGKLATLNDLVMGKLQQRILTAEFPLYKSVGAAIQDVTVAEIAYHAAVAQGRAINLDIELDIQHV